MVQRDTITGSSTMWANEPLVTREGWPLGEGVDAVAPAGALIIQNNRSAPPPCPALPDCFRGV